MKIGEVVDRLKAEFPALSVSKVRYLEAEGLIAPHRVGNGYRRYSTADVERLRYALTAQRDEYLPLSVIRERLLELDGTADAPPPAVARVVASGGRTVSGALNAEDLVHHSGASLEQVEELVAIGVIAPDAHGRFDTRALATVSLALQAGRLGIPLRNLRAVRSAAEREADAIDLATQHKRNRSTTAGEDAAAELAGVLADLHSNLLHRAVEALR
ncbi:MerR family transcriptional regulator [Actinomyces sp. MRS3W]|uniref:transcriptional regulator FtsR n=1 Tax=Actinomyces sp. MRS3W TaxID=2800796 RepID=UPI0028FD7FB6|nr:MerR family transcriptional regulator [Actinomyces sp. MRS3W]MDU0348958.1 MerR family transcriptional regulator [Actinomyces sp. MRS3W]